MGQVLDLIEQKQYFKIEKVQLRGITLSCKHPNNIVQLYDDNNTVNQKYFKY